MIFVITEQYVEYKERETKNRQGDEGNAKKLAWKYDNKIWKTDGGERNHIEHSQSMSSIV